MDFQLIVRKVSNGEELTREEIKDMIEEIRILLSAVKLMQIEKEEK